MLKIGEGNKLDNQYKVWRIVFNVPKCPAAYIMPGLHVAAPRYPDSRLLQERFVQ
jgi:hypothetical protein